MKEVIDLIDFLQKQTQGISNGINNFLQSLPVFTNQQLESIADKELQSTKQEFLENTDVYYTQDYVLVVEIDPSSWIANAVESGVSGFDMKQGFLNSKNVKLSKDGYKYFHVPIEKNPQWSSGTVKGQFYDERIKNALQNPQFMLSNWKQQSSGEIIEYQQLQTDDEVLKGFYRTRQYKDKESVKKSKPKWGYIMFRTVSEKSDPNSWQHPGIEKHNILRSVEQWLHESVDTLLDNFIKSELDKTHGE